jgi:hypothetical protein
MLFRIGQFKTVYFRLGHVNSYYIILLRLYFLLFCFVLDWYVTLCQITSF